MSDYGQMLDGARSIERDIAKFYELSIEMLVLIQNTTPLVWKTLVQSYWDVVLKR